MTFDIIKSAVEDAGFYTSHDVDGRRLICASMKRAEGDGLTGNSFWIAERNGDWFLGTWGPRFYRIPEHQRVPELCVGWLRRRPQGTVGDVDDYIRSEFGLIRLKDLPE